MHWAMESGYQHIMERCFAAILCGILLGAERSWRSKPAGIRTHVLISLGSCLFMVISEMVAHTALKAGFTNPDPARIAAQVVSGVGFLGAGALLRNNFAIKGLTSAATIWCMAAIGLACGSNLYFTALSSTILIVILLQVMQSVENNFGSRRKREMSLQIFLHKTTKPKQIRKIRVFLRDLGVPLMNENVHKILGEIQYIANIKINRNSENDLLEKLLAMPDIKVLDAMILKQSESWEI